MHHLPWLDHRGLPRIGISGLASGAAALPTLAFCLERLKVQDDETCLEIAELLGCHWPARIESTAPTSEAGSQSDPQRSSGQNQNEPEGSTRAHESSMLPGEGGSLIRLAELPKEKAEPHWEAIPPVQDSSAQPLLPLLNVQEQRALVTTMLEMPQRTPWPDLPRLIEAFATARSLRELPMQQTLSLSKGAQVLVDLSEHLCGFYEDQQQALSMLRNTLGPTIEILDFADDPFEVQLLNALDGQPYARPLPGVPVLVLSDLGLFQRTEKRTEPQSRWLQFAHELAAQGSPLLVLSPLRAENFPTILRQRVTILTWDRITRIQTIRRERRGSRTYASPEY